MIDPTPTVQVQVNQNNSLFVTTGIDYDKDGSIVGSEITEQQVNSLLQLIDIAIKAGGYQNAKVAVPLADIILDAAKTQ